FLFLFVGRDFFPAIDGGQIQLHVRVPAGTRIEKTEQMFQRIEDKIREIIPASERGLIVDNIGLPGRLYNLANEQLAARQERREREGSEWVIPTAAPTRQRPLEPFAREHFVSLQRLRP